MIEFLIILKRRNLITRYWIVSDLKITLNNLYFIYWWNFWILEFIISINTSCLSSCSKDSYKTIYICFKLKKKINKKIWWNTIYILILVYDIRYEILKCSLLNIYILHFIKKFIKSKTYCPLNNKSLEIYKSIEKIQLIK